MNGLLIQMAMAAEASPFRRRMERFGEWELLAPPLPARVCAAEVGGETVHLVVHGSDPRFGVDMIGTQPAAVTAWAAITRLRPRIVIVAGTAGGFASAGGAIGDVYISDGPVAFHDRRVPLGAFETAGIGLYPSMDCRELAKTLGLKPGRLTTGDSLDMSETDARQIALQRGNVKDMEAAAVAWVASLFGLPFIGLKAITDLVDGEDATSEQFIRNLDRAADRLSEKLAGLVEALASQGR